MKQLFFVSNLNKKQLLDPKNRFGINSFYKLQEKCMAINSFVCWFCATTGNENNVYLSYNFLNKNIQITNIFFMFTSSYSGFGGHNVINNTDSADSYYIYKNNIHNMFCNINYFCISCGSEDSTKFASSIPLEYIQLF